jgi:regulator of ribonuclease activity B
MFSSTTWMYVFAIIGGVIAGWRIWQNLNKLRQRKNDSWDARLIDQLRKRGSDPFKPHDLDFFLAFPTREAADEVAAQMTTEGFKTDVIDTPESGDLRYSLHAQKSLHLTVPDMQELSRRLTDMATARSGRYDGWSAKQVPIADGPIH